MHSKMDLELIVAEFGGFLLALQRLCGPGYAFSAFLVERGTDEFASLQTQFAKFEGKFKLVRTEAVTHHQVTELLSERIYSKLAYIDAPVLKMLDWQLTEYYGLASTAADPGGSFHPLVSDGALLLSVSSTHYASIVSYAVPIKGHFIVTVLGNRA